jgi:DNA-binding XRE family transcriptional regulator
MSPLRTVGQSISSERFKIGARAGWSVGQAAWRLGVSVRTYREVEAGARSPSFETWDRICKLYGWPQTFVGNVDQSTAGV